LGGPQRQVMGSFMIELPATRTLDFAAQTAV